MNECDPERIFLAPSCGKHLCDEERLWCRDDVWDVCQEVVDENTRCGAKAVAYIRADVAAERERAAAEKARTQALKEAAQVCDHYPAMSAATQQTARICGSMIHALAQPSQERNDG